jgi:hypothetical protein
MFGSRNPRKRKCRKLKKPKRRPYWRLCSSLLYKAECGRGGTVDATDLKSVGLQSSWGFKSPRPHQNSTFFGKNFPSFSLKPFTGFAFSRCPPTRSWRNSVSHFHSGNQGSNIQTVARLRPTGTDNMGARLHLSPRTAIGRETSSGQDQQ